MQQQESKLKEKLRIIHFNDCYELNQNSEQPKGGAARLVAQINKIYDQQNTIVLFSGDLFSPSSISSIHRGSHMLPLIRMSKIDVSLIGNHQFDLPLNKLTVVINESKIPWLLSNLRDSQTMDLYANAHEYYVLEKCGLRIGLIGLAEKEWIDTLKEIKPHYEDFIQCSRRLYKDLKTKEKCDFVIALTHMRLSNDLLLATEVPELDMILGGHDHMNHSSCQKDHPLVIKSGGNFSYVSEIMLENLTSSSSTSEKVIQQQSSPTKPEEETQKKEEQNPSFLNFQLKNQYKIEHKLFTLFSEFEKDKEMEAVIDQLNESCKTVMKKIIGHTDAELDLRFSAIRSVGTNFTNFFSDVIRQEMKSDICLLNSGSIRLDASVPPGKIDFETIIKILPFNDKVISKLVKGIYIHSALENSVSRLPSLDGRFLCVSGIQFTCILKNPPMSRVPIESVLVDGKPLNFDHEYSISMIEFMGNGKQGYDEMKNCPFIVDPEGAMSTQNYFINFFNILNDENTFEKFAHQRGQEVIRPTIEEIQILEYKKLFIIRYIKEVDEEKYITIAPTFEPRIQFIE